MTCNPAHKCLRRVIWHRNRKPNYAAIAAALGVTKTTVIRWTIKRQPRGFFPRGTSGVIPKKYRQALVDLSRGRLTLADFETAEDAAR